MPSFGHTHSAYWARFTAHNRARELKIFILQIEYPYIDYIDSYQPLSTGAEPYGVVLTGERRPFGSRYLDYRNFTLRLELPTQTTKTFYLRFQSADAMIFIPTLWTPDEIAKRSSATRS